MLDTGIVFILVTWFLFIPLIIEIICWFKRKPMPLFFSYGSNTKCCIIGIALVGSFISFDIGLYDIMYDKTLLRWYVVITLIVIAIWSFHKFRQLSKYKHTFKDDDTMRLSVVVATFFGDSRAYEVFAEEHKDIPSPVWAGLKEAIIVEKVEDNLLKQLKDYNLQAERDAIDNKDAKLLLAVIKTKMKYLGNSSEVLGHYRAIKESIPETEEHKVIRELITNNPRMFKML